MKRWTKDEEELLKIWIKQGTLHKDIAEKLGRSIQSIKHKAMTLKIKSLNYQKAKTTEQYKVELPNDLIILESYINNYTKILHKHVCGYEWKVKPNHIKAGHSCPKCAGMLLKSTKQYINEIPKDLTVLEEYKGARVNILHEHSCGYKWKVAPNTILKGHSCPSCNTGFNSINTALTYLLYFPDIDVYKVGITNNLAKRQSNFGYNSKIILLRKFSKGQDAINLEKEWLSNVKPYLFNTGLLKSGNTETFKYD